MTSLLTIALSNLFVASVFGLCALLVNAFWRRPALVHGLWLLFFLKLLTPPLFPIAISWNQPLLQKAEIKPIVHESPPPVLDLEPEDMAGEPLVVREEVQAEVLPVVQEPLSVAKMEKQPTEVVAPFEIPWLEVGTGLWLLGSLCWFALASARLANFHKQLRFARPASEDLQQEAYSLADRMQVTCPEVWVLSGPLSPMLWVMGTTPRLLIPAGLLERLDDEQRLALLTHELAHWRRRDHWVRRLELLVLTLYWWCPLVWWARRHLQEAEEECCDAWVVWMMPGAARGYALALLETVDFMASAQAALPPVASGIGHVRLLKRRLTMIMQGTTPRTLTLSGGLAVLGLGALLLPLMPSWAQTPNPKPERGSEDQPNFTQNDPLSDKRSDLSKALKDIARMQADLERSRADLERRSRELQEMMDHVRKEALNAAKQQERMARDAAQQGERKARSGQGVQVGQNSGAGALPPGGGDPFGGGFGGPGAMGGSPSGIEKRLRALERKLDMLIQMMSRKGPPSATPSIAPGTSSALPVAPAGGAIRRPIQPGLPAIEPVPPSPPGEVLAVPSADVAPEAPDAAPSINPPTPAVVPPLPTPVRSSGGRNNPPTPSAGGN